MGKNKIIINNNNVNDDSHYNQARIIGSMYSSSAPYPIQTTPLEKGTGKTQHSRNQHNLELQQQTQGGNSP